MISYRNSVINGLRARKSPQILVQLLSVGLVWLFAATTSQAGWQAGTASAVITPPKPMWMAGYGSRTQVSSGKVHDLYIRLVALEDEKGQRSLILASDTLGMTRSIYDNVCKALKETLGLERAQIMLNSSHTHCGPVLRGGLYDIYPLDQEQLDLIEEHSNRLESQIVTCAQAAFGDLEPVVLDSGLGTTAFAVNRRNNREGEVPGIRFQQKELQGPVSHDVPVLSIRRADGKLKAIVFGYACHNTTLSFNRWCGDYAGFAQLALERSHPDCLALFAMGCGADQNPIPRRTVELAERYGHMLAAAVEVALLQPMKRLKPVLQTDHRFITLDFGPPPTKDELTKIASGKVNYRQRWANRLLKQMESGKPFETNYRYPLQVWRMGEEQLWITMGGEVVVDYALRFKSEFGKSTWVTGYCNDVMAYIPSLRVLDEDSPPRSGYEGNTSMIVYGVPAHRWAPSIEDRISSTVAEMVKDIQE